MLTQNMDAHAEEKKIIMIRITNSYTECEPVLA